jgi:hypothetical protein
MSPDDTGDIRSAYRVPHCGLLHCRAARPRPAGRPSSALTVLAGGDR